MNAPHLFVDPAHCPDGRVVLTGDVAHHVLRVLRRGAGDEVSVADGGGVVRRAVIRTITTSRAECEVVAEHAVPPPRPGVRVVCGLPKRRKFDEVVQRLTELGVDEIVPVISARSQVQLDPARASRAHARWQAVARAAAQQSRRARLPHIAPIGSWDAVFDAGVHGVVFWEDAVEPLHAVRFDSEVEQVTVGVGPEGGLTAQEAAMTGLPAVSLGPTILRAETAGVVAPALVMHRLGRLG